MRQSQSNKPTTFKTETHCGRNVDTIDYWKIILASVSLVTEHLEPPHLPSCMRNLCRVFDEPCVALFM